MPKIQYYYILPFLILGTFALYFYLETLPSTIDGSRECLIQKIRDISPSRFDKEWLKFHDSVNKCTKNVLQNLQTVEFPNSDEIKIGILPKNSDDECNVLTLGIGKDVEAEKELLKKLPHCKFIGIDPSETSGKLFTDATKGKFIQGVVGVRNGIYNSTVLGEDDKYMPKTVKHNSLKTIMSTFKDKIIDFLFMDIEGDEFSVIEDFINNFNEYPIICQLNVEFHDPLKNDRGKQILRTFFKSVQDNIFMPLKADMEPLYFFKRIFFINLNKICKNKFF